MDWSETIQKAVDFARGRSGLTLGELKALVPVAKPDDIDVLLAGLCDRGIWLTETRLDGDDAR